MLNTAILLTLAGLILAIAGLLLNLGKEKRERRKTELELTKEREYKQIAKDHGYALRCLEIIYPGVVRRGDGSHVYIRGEIFSDRDLQMRIKHYLGDQNPMTGKFISKATDLQNPECLRTISDVVGAVETWKAAHPQDAKHLGLPERVPSSSARRG